MCRSALKLCSLSNWTQISGRWSSCSTWVPAGEEHVSLAVWTSNQVHEVLAVKESAYLPRPFILLWTISPLQHLMLLSWLNRTKAWVPSLSSLSSANSHRSSNTQQSSCLESLLHWRVQVETFLQPRLHCLEFYKDFCLQQMFAMFCQRLEQFTAFPKHQLLVQKAGTEKLAFHLSFFKKLEQRTLFVSYNVNFSFPLYWISEAKYCVETEVVSR